MTRRPSSARAYNAVTESRSELQIRLTAELDALVCDDVAPILRPALRPVGLCDTHPGADAFAVVDAGYGERLLCEVCLARTPLLDKLIAEYGAGGMAWTHGPWPMIDPASLRP